MGELEAGRAGGAWPARVLAALLIVGVPLLLVLGRDQWFYLDELHILDPLGAPTQPGVLEPWWGHPIVVPRLMYSALYGIVGMKAYWPYQLGVVLAHVAVVGLLWLVMVRARVEPWLATAAAAFVLLFGPGRDDIVWGFQVSLTGSLALGLAQLVLADHDGGERRRDAAAVVCGLLAIAFSSIGLLMAVGVGAAVLLRRGWRAAAVVAGPPMAVYAVWWLAIARTRETPIDYRAQTVGDVVTYVRDQLWHFATSLGPGPIGPLLAAATIVGAAVVVASTRRGRPEWAATAGLLVAATCFVVSIGYGRGGGHRVDIAVDRTPGRYLHVLLVLVAPALVLGLSRLVEGRARWMIVIPIALVLLAIPANVRAFTRLDDPAVLGRPDRVVPSAEIAAGFDVVPPLINASLDARRLLPWLVEQHRAGRLPPTRGDEQVRAELFADIAFDPAEPPPAAGCEPVPEGGPVRLGLGDILSIEGPEGSRATVADVDRDLRTTFTVGPSQQLALVTTASPLEVTVALRPRTGVVAVCR